MINVYPSTLDSEPAETFEADGTTIEQWLIDNEPGYIPVDEFCAMGHEAPAITVMVNGIIVDPTEWGTTVIDRRHTVDIYPNPKAGGGSFLVAAIVSSLLSVAATALFRPSAPTPGSGQQAQQGQSIARASAQGNVAKMGDIIPEQAGRVRSYPDLLCMPRRRFTGLKEHSLHMMLNIGWGSFSIESLRVAETDFNDLPVDYQVFGPGADVSGHIAHENWYVAPEVGNTAGNTAGIKLLSPRDVADTWEGTLTFDGNAITSANGEQPTGWQSGLRLEIGVPIPVIVTGEGAENVFEGDFSHLMPAVGKELIIHRINDLDPTRHRFSSVTPGTVTLERRESGQWVTVNDWADGNYTLIMQRVDNNLQLASILLTGISGGVATVEYWLDGAQVTNWPGWPNVTTAQAKFDIDEQFAEGLWSNIYQACPSNENATFIEWDIFASEGLGVVDGENNMEQLDRTVQLRYRDIGGSAWTTVTENISGASRDQLGWTFQIPISPARPVECQVRRIEVEDNSISVLDSLEWFGLKARLPVVGSYPGMTTLALTLTGSNEIASQTENRVNVTATRVLERLDGNVTATRTIANWFRYVAHEAGYTDDDIDMGELARLNNTWLSRGETFNFRITDQTTVKDQLNKVLIAGMAETTVADGLLTPVRDEPRTEYEEMYTPQNMRQFPKRRFQARRPEDPDGVNVTYMDETTWTEEVVKCRLPGDAGNRAEQLSLDGVTDRTQVWRIGMRRRRGMEYYRWEYTFSTPMDALNSNYMSYVSVGDDVPSYGKSALILEATPDGGNVRLRLSEPMTFEAGQSHVIAWRKPNGTLSGPWTAQQGANAHEVIAMAPDNTPTVNVNRERPHIQFGVADRWNFPALVSKIDPQGLYQVNVTSKNYDARVYADDDNQPPG